MSEETLPDILARNGLTARRVQDAEAETAAGCCGVNGSVPSRESVLASLTKWDMAVVRVRCHLFVPITPCVPID